MGNEICFIRGKNDRVPVTIDVFKHGGGIYLAIGNQAENVHLALIGSAAAMVVELRLKADMIEAAMIQKDQGHISRADAAPRLNPAQSNWDWLTPQVVIEYFRNSAILRHMVDDVAAALKESADQGQPSQLDSDIDTIQPHIEEIRAGGKINKSEIARRLGIKPSGPANWARVQAVARVLEEEAA